MAKPSMAVKSNHAPPPLPVKEEKGPAPPPSQLSGTASVIGEPQELTNAAAATPPSVSPEKEEEREPHFIKSVNELRSLSTVIYAFRRRWDELQKHLDFIQNAIDSMSKQLDGSPHQHQQPQMGTIVTVTETPAPSAGKTPILDSSNLQIPGSEQKSLSGETAKHSSRSELVYLCEMMCSRGLRKYIISRLSDVDKLREEAPAALKSAPNPAKLVLECIGRFFLQGSKAFSKDSPMIPARQASLLILESFLLMGSTQIEPSVKEEAELAAIAWRKRFISEGGVSRASDIDARGLLLFVGSFGIPTVFRNEDLGDLIRLSNPREISDALRRSNVLLMRIPDVIEAMMKNGMNVEVVDVAYTFGVEDKFPPQTILTSFVRESKEAWKRTRREAQGSFIVLKEANEKQLAALKSVIKCLEDHKIDPLKLLPGWQINEKIINLEKDNADLDKKIEEKVMPKRKADEIESSKILKSQDVRRSRFTAKGSFPENILAAGVGAGMLAGTGGVLSTGFAGVHRGMLVDKVGQVMTNNGRPYGWLGDAAFSDRFIGHGFAEQPAPIGVNGLFGPPSVEGCVGLPNPPSIGVSNRSSASDLYQFADAVLEGESYHSSGSRNAGTMPAAVHAHQSSYLY